MFLLNLGVFNYNNISRNAITKGKINDATGGSNSVVLWSKTQGTEVKADFSLNYSDDMDEYDKRTYQGLSQSSIMNDYLTKKSRYATFANSDFSYYNVGYAGFSLLDDTWTNIDKVAGDCITNSYKNDRKKGL